MSLAAADAADAAESLAAEAAAQAAAAAAAADAAGAAPPLASAATATPEPAVSDSTADSTADPVVATPAPFRTPAAPKPPAGIDDEHRPFESKIISGGTKKPVTLDDVVARPDTDAPAADPGTPPA